MLGNDEKTAITASSFSTGPNSTRTSETVPQTSHDSFYFEKLIPPADLEAGEDNPDQAPFLDEKQKEISRPPTESSPVTAFFWMAINTIATVLIVRRFPYLLTHNKPLTDNPNNPTGLHQQIHLLHPLPPTHPTLLRNLPLPHYLPNPLHLIKTSALPLHPAFHLAPRHSPPQPRHVAQRDPSQFVVSLQLRDLLPNRSDPAHADGGSHELRALRFCPAGKSHMGGVVPGLCRGRDG